MGPRHCQCLRNDLLMEVIGFRKATPTTSIRSPKSSAKTSPAPSRTAAQTAPGTIIAGFPHSQKRNTAASLSQLSPRPSPASLSLFIPTSLLSRCTAATSKTDVSRSRRLKEREMESRGYRNMDVLSLRRKTTSMRSTIRNGDGRASKCLDRERDMSFGRDMSLASRSNERPKTQSQKHKSTSSSSQRSNSHCSKEECSEQHEPSKTSEFGIYAKRP